MFKKMKIRTKIFLGFASAIFLLLVVAFTSAATIWSSSDNFSDYRTIARNSNNAGRIQANMLISRLEVKDFFISRNMEDIKHFNGRMDSLFTFIEYAVNSYEDEERLQMAMKVKELAEEYKATFVKLVRKFEQTGEIDTALMNRMDNIGPEVASIAEEMKLDSKREQDILGPKFEASNENGIRLIVIIGLAAILLAVFFAFAISNAVTRPVRVVADRVEQLRQTCITNLANGLVGMAEGNLDVKVEKGTPLLKMEHKDEIGALAGSVDGIILQAQGGIDKYEIVRARINELIAETGNLVQDSRNGLLDNRADESKFKGAYAELIEGMNDMLDAIIKPVQEGADVLAVMATGDLRERVKGDYKGQHQMIKESINKLGDSLSGLIAEVFEAVQATASASSQISSSSEEMAAGSQEQSAQTSEVAAAIEQMTKTIFETSQHASSAAEIAQEAGSKAGEGGSAVKETISGMNQISAVVTESAETVRKLGESSDQIGEIIQVIDDIADQTNLLALNAAIEAARAGEQGRGFAVVADEVRKLAERTTKATKEIATMIRKIQDETGGAVTSMNQGTEKVAAGKQIAERTGLAMKEIVTSSNSVLDIVAQVATASEEQSSAAEEISKNIDAINSVTHESAAGVQQIARAAEDLNRLTDNLQVLIEGFKFDAAGNRNSKRLTQSEPVLEENSNGNGHGNISYFNESPYKSD